MKPERRWKWIPANFWNSIETTAFSFWNTKKNHFISYINRWISHGFSSNSLWMKWRTSTSWFHGESTSVFFYVTTRIYPVYAPFQCKSRHDWNQTRFLKVTISKPMAITTMDESTGWVTQRCTIGRDDMKSTHSIHRQKPLSYELRSEWASKRMNERSRARKQREQCGASEWVSGASERANKGGNGPVLYASIS